MASFGGVFGTGGNSLVGVVVLFGNFVFLLCFAGVGFFLGDACLLVVCLGLIADGFRDRFIILLMVTISLSTKSVASSSTLVSITLAIATAVLF